MHSYLNYYMKVNWYPLIFEPILKDRIWGGTKLHSLLNKTLPTTTTGESWEISSVPGDSSIIKNGIFQGTTLNDLVAKYPQEILGKAVYKKFGNQFPLLFKFLDAQEDLSIQLHPNDELAKKRHNSFGKTEMWYVMQADENSRIIVGFKENSSADEYLRHLEDKTLPTILKEISVKQGDAFFLKTGTIHAIGAGIVIAEIQQTSDITYRVYDWDRVDSNGKSRELHVELALEAINYNEVESQKQYGTIQNESNLIVECPYFITNFIPLDGNVTFHKDSESFTVLMCTDGQFELTSEGSKSVFKKGETILLPAAITQYELLGKASILEIYL